MHNTAARSALALGLAAALLTAACSGSSSGGGSASTGASAATTPSSTASSTPSTGATTASSSASASTAATFPSQANAPKAQYYVSIGDSYAAGYQPTGTGSGATTRNGFAYQVVGEAKAKGYDYTLVNFGCSGATTTSVLRTPGCPAKALGPGAPNYTSTQAAAAEKFIKANRAKIGLITVSVGGNDVTACGAEADPTTCLTTALGTVSANLKTLVAGLRSAAGQDTRIVGITYPDVLLGSLLSKQTQLQNTAKLSVLAFQALINPALKSAYEGVGGKFVDVTAATGAYGPLTATTTLAPYGTIPVPVAKVCQLTFFCQYQDIHPRTNGYAIIAGLVVGTLPHH